MILFADVIVKMFWTSFLFFFIFGLCGCCAKPDTKTENVLMCLAYIPLLFTFASFVLSLFVTCLKWIWF